LKKIRINSVTNSQIRGDSFFSDGSCFGKAAARTWIFIAFLLSFGSLIASAWIFFDFHVSKGILIKHALIKNFKLLN
jgi:hypothetical protein